MKHLSITKFIIALYTLILLLFSSCSNDLSTGDFTEEKMDIVNECRSSNITTVDVLEGSIIGKWKFYAGVCEMCIEPYFQEKREYTFSEDGIGSYKSGDLEYDFLWEVSNGSDGVRIAMDPSTHDIRTMSIFCEEYMISELSEGALNIFKKG